MAVSAALWSCAGKSEEYTPIEVTDLASVMQDYSSLDSLSRDSLLHNHRAELEAFMKAVGADSVSDTSVFAWSNSAPVRVFTPAIDSVYSNRAIVGGIIGGIVARADKNGFELPNRHYATVVYGRPESMLFVDSVMLIALNHYLGSDYEGYARWPEYMRSTKTPANLPYDIAEALVATSYPYEADAAHNTLLAGMLYQGALAYARKELVADGDVASALGYDKATYQSLEENEEMLWKSLVESGMLYSTSQRDIDRLLAPAPYCMVGGKEFAGRAGRFIGFKIVESYMSSYEDASLADLFDKSFYQSDKTLAQANYKP